MNENTEYEKLTKAIYEALLKAQGIDTVQVQHNVKLAGTSKQPHQIDVYWEYNVAGVLHRVAIECKNYNKPVSIGHVRDFYGVLSDLKGVNGIMVTTIGYQHGAKEFANTYGINLKELRKPTDDDWQGRIKTINIQMNMIVPQILERTPIFDKDWLEQNKELLAKHNNQYTMQGMANEICIYNEQEEVISNFHILDQQVPPASVATTGMEHTYNFPGAYLKLEPFGKIKINGVKYRYNINVGTREIKIDGSEGVLAILKDTISGEIKFFDKDGSIK
ncbi:MAG: restriction endonuclease [Bacteroidia bacterium]